jgi:hypothetical protein
MNASFSDRQDLQSAITKRFAGRRIPQINASGGYQMQDTSWLNLFLDQYNPDPQWQSDVRSALSFVRYPQISTIAATPALGVDQRPAVELVQFEARGTGLFLRGTASGEVASIVLQPMSYTGKEGDSTVIRLGTREGRNAWECNIALADAITGLMVGFTIPDPDFPSTDADEHFLLPVVQKGVGDCTVSNGSSASAK